MRLTWLLPVLLLSPTLAWAQGAAKEGPGVRVRAKATKGASVSVTARDAPADPAAKANPTVAKKQLRGKARAEAAGAEGLAKAEEMKAEKTGEAEGDEAAPGRRRGAPPHAAQRRHGRSADLMRRLVECRANPKAARAKARHGKRARLQAMLGKGHAKMPRAALRQELRRNARRLARIARVRELAEAAGDEKNLERVDVLFEHEMKRHERWMGKQGLDVAAPPGAPAQDPPAAPPGAPAQDPPPPAQGGTP